MDWKTIKEQGYMEIDGTRYDLSHLQDAWYDFVIEASGRYAELKGTLLVQYSSHCVSWGPKRGERIDFNIQGEQRRIIDDKGVHRCFCNRRYQLSAHLPHIFETFADRWCLFTGYENWLTIEVLGPAGEPQEYEVYFRVTKQSRSLLRIYVESAYVRDKGYGDQKHTKHRRDKVRAKVLLAKKLRGEPVRRPSRGRK
ncbi:hypothetical protein AAIA72_11460 [Hahella sp. SMD15-11]|uniref:Uncharacterized protein n=1 Tax=Thermohahella caldifontis TaxID=3142973 RepID=A0AB39UUB0_9GAMM